MSSKETYSGDVIQVLMGTDNGTAGDMMFVSVGSAYRYASGAGTGNTNAFIGILVDNCGSGQQASIRVRGVVSMPKISSSNKIEVGDRLCGTKSDNNVGTLIKGTSIGVCVKQSSTTDSYVDMMIVPCFISGARDAVV